MLKQGLMVILMVFMMTGFAQEQKKNKKEVKTTTFECSMHCGSCQKKIEHNIAFEKGVKAVTTDLKDQTVTVTYRSDKNTETGVQDALKKLGYKATIKKENPVKATEATPAKK